MAAARSAASGAATAAGVLQHQRQALGRIGGIERHVGAAGLEDAEQRRRPAPASARRRARPARSGPTPSRAQVVRRAGWPARRARRRSALRRRRPRATASGRARGLRLEQLVDQGARGTRRGGVVPLDEELLPLGRREQRQLGEPSVRGRPRRRRAASAKCASHAARSSRRRTGRSLYSSVAGEPRRRSSRSASVRSNFAVAVSDRAARSSVSPGSVGVAARRVLQHEHHLEQRRAAEVALRLQLLDQLLERQVLVRVGAQRVPRAPAPAARRKRGRPARSARSTSVLTKKPISAFDLRPVAVGDRRADDDVVLPGVAGEQRLEGRRAATMNEASPPRAGRAPAAPRRAAAASADRAVRAAEALHRRPRPVGRQLQDGRGARRAAARQ